MAEINGGDSIVVAVFAVSAFGYSAYHTYMYDRCRCLVPRKKDWFRALLMWMLLGSSMGMLVWAVGWAYVKYQLGWVYLGPDRGARPWPSALFLDAYKGFNKPLTIVISVAYSLQASLNAEEALFWYHGMRSVRAPHRARAWIGSAPFWAWVGISLATAGLQIGIPWINYDPMHLQWQLALELCVGGVIEFIVVIMATVILWRFPRFMDEIKASGAGPEVRARLHFYHEANKVRTFFRYIFAIALMMIGADGMTERAVINWSPIATDTLVTLVSGSFSVVLVVSVIIYLPRTYGAERGRVMVGAQHRPESLTGGARGRVGHGNGDGDGDGQHTGHFALVTLLREGGQIGEDEAVEMAYMEAEGRRLRDAGALPGSEAEAEGKGFGRNGREAFGNKEAAASVDWSLARETREEDWSNRPALPAENFTSPIVPHVEDTRAAGPVKVRVHVERQVHED